MPRRRGRTDANHTEIVRGLRRLGASLQELDPGNGCPDLLVGALGRNILLEIKNRDGRARRVKSTRDVLQPNQREWFDAWRGARPHIVYDLDDAIEIVFGVCTKVGGTD